MIIYEAQVTDTTDITTRGYIQVYCKKMGEYHFKVVYTSPYSAGAEGGFIAIPDIGSQILILKPDGSDDWYYMTTIVTPSQGIAEKWKAKGSGTVMPDNRIYQANATPQKILLQDPAGNKLSLSHLANDEFINRRAELKSSVGKKLILSDSPYMDCVLLKNEHNDGLKITARSTPLTPSRSIELECRGSQAIVSRESSIDIMVHEGRELNIGNTSTGINRNPGAVEEYGNINIFSKRRDINLTVYEDNGKVFIDALGSDGLIQIDSGNKITIYANQNVEIRAGKDLLLKAEGNINLEAGKSISMKSATSNTIDSGGSTNIKAGSNVNLDGAQVHLNSGFASPGSSVKVDKIANSYNN